MIYLHLLIPLPAVRDDAKIDTQKPVLALWSLTHLTIQVQRRQGLASKLVTVKPKNVVSDFTIINFLCHHAALTWLVHLRRNEHLLRCPPLCHVLLNYLSADLV